MTKKCDLFALNVKLKNSLFSRRLSKSQSDRTKVTPNDHGKVHEQTSVKIDPDPTHWKTHLCTTRGLRWPLSVSCTERASSHRYGFSSLDYRSAA